MEDYISTLSTRDYSRRLSARSARYATVVIPSEIVSIYWRNVDVLHLHFDESLNCLIMTPDFVNKTPEGEQ
jgi:hypothetical protein